MTVTAGHRPVGWRESWAQQENARRRQAHEAARAVWQRRDSELAHYLDVAMAFQPGRDSAAHGWVRRKRDENVYWTGGAAMVETATAAGLRVPDARELGAALASSGTPGLALPHLDTGQVAVTSHRVVFLGRSRREWGYAKLAGMAHTSAGQTLMLVTNRQKVSGLAPPMTSLGEFRLLLGLAMADASGERDRFASGLREQLERHREATPPPPGPARPEQAPVLAWFSGVRLAAVVVAAMLVLCSGMGVALAAGAANQNPAPPAAGPDSPSPTVVASPLRAASAPTSSASPTPSPSLVVADSPSAERDAVPGDCAAYVNSGWWCVDGTGDYDCDGGSGNGPNYAPEGVELVDPDVDPFGLDRDGDGEACERSAAPPPPAPAPPPPPPAPDTDPRFDTCGDAKTAGYGPYYRGQDPEYDWYRDSDSDGVVCE